MELIHILNECGFMKVQKTIYMNNNTTLIHTWNLMVVLMTIELSKKFKIIVNSLIMQYVH
jgi:hypothetical protein